MNYPGMLRPLARLSGPRDVQLHEEDDQFVIYEFFQDMGQPQVLAVCDTFTAALDTMEDV